MMMMLNSLVHGLVHSKAIGTYKSRGGLGASINGVFVKQGPNDDVVDGFRVRCIKIRHF